MQAMSCNSECGSGDLVGKGYTSIHYPVPERMTGTNMERLIILASVIGVLLSGAIVAVFVKGCFNQAMVPISITATFVVPPIFLALFKYRDVFDMWLSVCYVGLVALVVSPIVHLILLFAVLWVGVIVLILSWVSLLGRTLE